MGRCCRCCCRRCCATLEFATRTHRHLRWRVLQLQPSELSAPLPAQAEAASRLCVVVADLGGTTVRRGRHASCDTCSGSSLVQLSGHLGRPSAFEQLGCPQIYPPRARARLSRLRSRDIWRPPSTRTWPSATYSGATVGCTACHFPAHGSILARSPPTICGSRPTCCR